MTPVLAVGWKRSSKVPDVGAAAHKEAPAESPQLPEARHKEDVP